MHSFSDYFIFGSPFVRHAIAVYATSPPTGVALQFSNLTGLQVERAYNREVEKAAAKAEKDAAKAQRHK